MKRNETKLSLLSSLEELQQAPWYLIKTWVSYRDNVDLSDGAVRMCLSRLYKWRLVNRKNGSYSLTTKGKVGLVEKKESQSTLGRVRLVSRGRGKPFKDYQGDPAGAALRLFGPYFVEVLG